MCVYNWSVGFTQLTLYFKTDMLFHYWYDYKAMCYLWTEPDLLFFLFVINRLWINLYSVWSVKVTDMMLQDQHYPDWGKAARRFWKQGNNRIVLFWYSTSSLSLTTWAWQDFLRLPSSLTALYIPASLCVQPCMCYVFHPARCRVTCSQ